MYHHHHHPKRNMKNMNKCVCSLAMSTKFWLLPSFPSRVKPALEDQADCRLNNSVAKS